MPANTQAASTAAKRKRTSTANDAVALLKADHAEVKAMFEQYEGLGKRALKAKKTLATKICHELIKHTTAEEEIFYPAVRADADDSEDLVDEATVEHASAKDLIAQILSMEPGDDLYDAKVTVLSEQIEHHVKEEEQEMFPKARASDLDLVAMADAIAERKKQVVLPG